MPRIVARLFHIKSKCSYWIISKSTPEIRDSNDSIYLYMELDFMQCIWLGMLLHFCAVFASKVFEYMNLIIHPPALIKNIVFTIREQQQNYYVNGIEK
ncbi:unnamed protein product [Mucor hiemalis]